jgi:hypothetical protein
VVLAVLIEDAIKRSCYSFQPIGRCFVVGYLLPFYRLLPFPLPQEIDNLLSLVIGYLFHFVNKDRDEVARGV